MEVNGKKLPVPAFFTISNMGGGASDKYRETVYMDLFLNVPTLHNYYYLNYPKFANKWLRNIDQYSTIGSFLQYVREDMIHTEGFIYENHKPDDINCENTIHLLDSGAANILNDILLEKIGRKTDQSVLDRFFEEIEKYYDFAARYKFDMVIGFDLGGKYTFKGDERHDEDIHKKDEYLADNAPQLNLDILKKSIEYLRDKDYAPKVLATIHGTTPDDYARYTQAVLDLEEKYDYEFWGFALGGMASSNNLDSSWMGKGGVSKAAKNAIAPTLATQIVRGIVGNRPIHALGCGGYYNIVPLFLAGATSFDTQSPGRRAYDGNTASVEHVFEPAAGGSFTKYLVGKFDEEGKIINVDRPLDYVKLNLLEDTIELCGCTACKQVSSIADIKALYATKTDEDSEGYYYSRQICNAHSIWQHIRLCNICSETGGDFCAILERLGSGNLASVISEVHEYCDIQR